MTLAAGLQIAGIALLVCAALTVSVTLGLAAAGLLVLVFGLWEELS